MPDIVWEICLVVILIVASIFDVREHRIPNWLIVIGLIIGFASSASVMNALWKIAYLLIFFAFGALRLMGMGDIKLLMVISSFLGFWRCVFALGIGALIFAVFYIVRDRKRSEELLRGTMDSLKTQKRITIFDQPGYAFAPFILIGVIPMLLW